MWQNVGGLQQQIGSMQLHLYRSDTWIGTSLTRVSTRLHQLETDRLELLLLLRKEDEDKESKRELIDVRCKKSWKSLLIRSNLSCEYFFEGSSE